MSKLLDKIVLPIEKLAFIKVISNGKRPAEKHGFKDAQTGFDVVGTLASGYNLGFVMEPDFIAIDMDEDAEKGYKGIKVIENLEKELGDLPSTYTQRTPRGGLHKVFLAKGLKHKPTGKITPAVDVKYSGYILFHGSCINGRYYQAVDGQIAIVNTSLWLLREILAKCMKIAHLFADVLIIHTVCQSRNGINLLV